jgi:hypothetical protein
MALPAVVWQQKLKGRLLPLSRVLFWLDIRNKSVPKSARGIVSNISVILSQLHFEIHLVTAVFFLYASLFCFSSLCFFYLVSCHFFTLFLTYLTPNSPCFILLSAPENKSGRHAVLRIWLTFQKPAQWPGSGTLRRKQDRSHQVLSGGDTDSRCLGILVAGYMNVARFSETSVKHPTKLCHHQCMKTL